VQVGVLKRKRIITEPKEIGELTALVEKYGLAVIKLGRGQPYKSKEQWCVAKRVDKISLSTYMIIELKDTKLEITTRYYDRYFKYGTPCTYIFDLNGDDIFSQSGLDCFKEFSRAYKIPNAKEYENDRLNRWLDEESGKYVCTASPILGYNKKYEKQELKYCYEYDLNSAYAATIMEKIPDLYHPIFAEWPKLIKVNKGEVGFMLDDTLSMVEAGGKADVKFKLIDTPYKLKAFLKRWYDIKKNSQGLEKLKAKAMLNLPIGYCQRYNPFLRSYVVNKCNNVIKGLMDDETLFWNTDAIFTLNRRPELELGLEIGQFKEVKCDTLKYIGNVYQINDEDPTYRGISKAWFRAFEKEYGRKYDLLKDFDKKISRINYYDFDWEAMKLEVTEHEKTN
jgi:hypothetical protein